MNDITMTLIGRAVQDPEYIGENDNTVKFTIATDLKRNKDTKEFEAIFINCLLFPGVAERYTNMIPYINKGTKLMITGALSDVSSYVSNTTKEPRSQVSMRVYSISFVSSGMKKEEDGSKEMISIRQSRPVQNKRTIPNRRDKWSS